MKKILNILGFIIVAVIILFIQILGALQITEFNPKDVQDSVTINKKEDLSLIELNQELQLFSWNIGYGALDETADFFMDGGKKVYTATKDKVKSNIENIKNIVQNKNPDFVFFQEVDMSSSRSNYVREVDYFGKEFANYNATYARNYKVQFVPFPLPPLGKVDSGIMTMSKYNLIKSERISLPVSFSWPIRLANLKRCLMVNRYQIKDSTKELVMINFHLEAYDDGQGKIEQTKVLARVLKEEYDKGNYVIAGGDFNQIFSNQDLNRFKVKEGLWTPGVINVEDFHNYVPLMDDTYPTCRSLDQSYVDYVDKDNFQYYLIDGFLVSDNIEIKELNTLNYDFKYSDHNPVFLKFIVK